MSNKTKVKQPYNLSPRIQWLRDYYFKGTERNWKNESLPFTTGTEWDVVYDELPYYIVPESYASFDLLASSMRLSAVKVKLCEGFWEMNLLERRAWFNKEVLLHYLPQEILPHDLLCGARFNMHTSLCLNQQEAKERETLMLGEHGVRSAMLEFHDKGFGNMGPTSGHLIPNYAKALQLGFKGILAEIDGFYAQLTPEEQQSEKGSQLRAMRTAAQIPGELAQKYAGLCQSMAQQEQNPARKQELLAMEQNMRRVPYEPATNFYEAVQALWLTHMLVMSDENYPGPGISFGRIDQYLLPYYETSIAQGMDVEFAKDILKCFFIHCNTAYDSMITTGNQGITAGFGQLFNLSGMGKGGKDMTNALTWVFLDVIDEMYPILEPKPNVRLHKNSPDALLDKVTDMIAASQGAPFLINFDERSMAGLLREAEKAKIQHLIHPGNVFDYASVGCLENTMVGNDRSATVDINLNLVKAVELALGNGRNLVDYASLEKRGELFKQVQEGPETGPAASFETFNAFYKAFETQLRFLIGKVAELYNRCDIIRGTFSPTPYLSCLVDGCAQSGKDVTRGGAQIRFITVEGVTYGTTIDSLLAVKYLVYDKKLCSMAELVQALQDNWQGHEVLQAMAVNKAPKYGRDDDEADELGRQVMELWSEELWKYKSPLTNAVYRGGMLSWNYWVGDGKIVVATPDGRARGQFLSNAICPCAGADINGPTANINSVGKVLGGKQPTGDFDGYVNYLPNGSSHTITLNPFIVRGAENKAKFKALLRGYIENGGTALQINILDADMLKDAQKHPDEYKNLLVRVTGYNAYFTSVGKELQDEIIARESHKNY